MNFKEFIFILNITFASGSLIFEKKIQEKNGTIYNKIIIFYKIKILNIYT